MYGPSTLLSALSTMVTLWPCHNLGSKHAQGQDCTTSRGARQFIKTNFSIDLSSISSSFCRPTLTVPQVQLDIVEYDGTSMSQPGFELILGTNTP